MTVDDADEMSRRTGRDHDPIGSQPTMSDGSVIDQDIYDHTVALLEDMRTERADLQEQLDRVVADLERFREREPSVLELLGAVHGILSAEARGVPYSFKPLELAVFKLAVFKLTSREQPAAPPKAAG